MCEEEVQALHQEVKKMRQNEEDLQTKLGQNAELLAERRSCDLI